ncbi:MAG: DUF1080 domain-containing protein [Acidobacteria bacterium]|nr:DUF1080 domain-containing protein [Acidobacteriota bacterium]
MRPLALFALIAAHLSAQPLVVKPGASPSQPPADAIILFDGSGLNEWTKPDGASTGCTIDKDKSMLCVTGAKDAVSNTKHRNTQLHIEYKLPAMPDQKGQLKGNSGVFLMDCFELQVLDSLNNPTYADGIAGALYGFAPPKVNASKPAEEWQTYDVIFTAPTCTQSGELDKPALATVMHNGILVQHNTVMPKKGAGCKQTSLCEPGPIRLQDHSGFPKAPRTEMRFRNIWLRNWN